MKETPNAVAFPLVAVAIDRDKGCQNALRWTIDNLLQRGQTLTLVHVNTKFSSPSRNQDDHESGFKVPTEPHLIDLYLPFRCFCTRKDIHCKDVLLEDVDIAKAIVEFVSTAAVEKLVLGSPSRGGFVRRFKAVDTPNLVSKNSPDFCTVYVISKGKVSSMRNSVRPAPTISPLRAQIQAQASFKHDMSDHRSLFGSKGDSTPDRCSLQDDQSIRSPFTRNIPGYTAKAYDLSFSDTTDISFVSSGHPSVDRQSVDGRGMYPSRMSNASDGFDMGQTPKKSTDSYSVGTDFSYISNGSTGSSWTSSTLDDIESEMRRLKLELKQTMDMYNSACKEALTEKHKATELNRWKIQEEQRIEEARSAQGAALAMVDRERAKYRAALEAAEAHQRVAEMEAQKRVNAEMKALKEAQERKNTMEDAPYSDVRYRRYSIEEIEKATDYFAENRKIGEGGYGPVFRCTLDHTQVAVKVLRPDAAQGRSQFQQEVQVLSCIRHPNMVLLLGACPEYGCLVYEFMANGSLDDRLFRRGGTPVIPWQHRVRIAAEIATGLHFLHQTKPEPLVHRDLKPGNILLDRNYVSKISDVGLARLVPPSVADTVTQYRMTSTAGTFCYIDPEYQQTGMLGVKSDVYSLGIMLLQIITAKPPMGLTHVVSRAIEMGSFAEVLDQAVKDWPVEEALVLAEVALKCAELRRKDRPDLGTVVLPELERLRALGEENMDYFMVRGSRHSSPMQSQASLQDMMSDPQMHSGYESRSGESSSTDRRSNVT